MYCSHCGKKVGEDMLFCPFCGKPIVIPEQDDTPVADAQAVNAPKAAPVADAAQAAPVEKTSEEPTAVDSVLNEAVQEPETVGAAEAIAQDKPTSVLNETAATNDPEESGSTDDAAAELLDWSRERESHLEKDVWARPEAPAEAFSPLVLEEADGKPEEADWREEIARKKQAVNPEKKPPEIKRGEESPVRLEGAAPKLEQGDPGEKAQGKGQKRRKPANTLVPPKTMDPEDIFMDDRRAPYEDPYDDEDADDDLRGSFSFEDEEESSFFMRHLRGIVGLALFVILLLLFVIYAFSRAGQQSLARVNAAWSVDAYSTLGYQYFQAADYAQAGLYYERALQRDPNSYTFASSAAMAYLEAGNNDKAAAMLKRCAEIDPTKLEPYVYLLKLYPDAASRPWDITQLLQQGYQRTGDARLNVTG